MKRKSANTRERILETAARMFGEEGVRAATIDAIAAAAGVTKRTLYYHFRSKDDLIALSLTGKQGVEQGAIEFVSGASNQSVERLLIGIFSNIAVNASNARWRGCAFSQTAIELAGLPGHPAVAAVKSYKCKVERFFRAQLEALGSLDAAGSARRLVILIDGAITHSLVHHDPSYAREAGKMALELVAAEHRKATGYARLPDRTAGRDGEMAGVDDMCRALEVDWTAADGVRSASDRRQCSVFGSVE